MKIRIIICLVLLAWSGRTASSGNTAHSVADAHKKSTSNNSDAVFNLADFGALGDGVTDDSPALQSAMDALAEAGGGTLFVPAGRYALLTPVYGNFSGLDASVTILGVESLTPVPPPNSTGLDLSRGLDLVSEFAPRTGELGSALTITGLEDFLIKDITFIGTPDVGTDAVVTLAFYQVRQATIRHCEFYGLRSMAAGGAVVLSYGSDLHLEQSVFLGCSGNSSLKTPVVEIVEWKGVTVSNAIFIDYGQRPELFGKLGTSTPYSWINIGNAFAAESTSPRRQVVIKDVFFDEGAIFGLSSIPNTAVPSATPFDLLHISGLFMNVSNLNSSGHHLSGIKSVLIEDSHYGWSQSADSAIHILDVDAAILDRVECTASANRIRADAETGNLTVIDSIYDELDSLAQNTRVINNNAPGEDPVQFVRQQFIATLGQEPDAAALFFWSDRQLNCGDDLTCLADQRAALTAYLNTSPAPVFSISGRVNQASSAGLPGVVITLGGSQSVTTETDSEGRYQFNELPTSGVYTLTAGLVNYTFEPQAPTITTPSGNQTVDFAALDAHRITVRIMGPDGNASVGTTVNLSGTRSSNGVTDASGRVVFEPMPAGGNYVLTPERQNYTFSPTSIGFSDLNSDETANFMGTPPGQIEFSQGSYSVTEGTTTISVTVRRIGDSSGPAEVIFSGSDGSADQRSDVIPVMGILSFEPGESSNSFVVFITDDAHVEGDESFTLQLSDPVGGILGNSSATLVIVDNDSGEADTNPIDDAEFFVRQQYRDFLNRPPDPEGLAFWTNQILSCATDQACIADRRMNVSAAFFLSIEFQETGFLVYRLYQASYGQSPKHLDEFLLDTRTIGEGVIVNAPGWQELIEANKAAVIEDFVRRAQFNEAYPPDLTPSQFVSLLNQKTGGALSPDEVAAAVAEFQGEPTSESIVARCLALRRVAENGTFSQTKLNSAFVLMQYFGYLQRNPDDTPDSNLDGFNFWLNKLEEFNGDFRRADMVKSFLVSSEYRARFGAP